MALSPLACGGVHHHYHGPVTQHFTVHCAGQGCQHDPAPEWREAPPRERSRGGLRGLLRRIPSKMLVGVAIVAVVLEPFVLAVLYL